MGDPLSQFPSVSLPSAIECCRRRCHGKALSMNNDSIAATRAQLLERLLPGGVPVLWCPLLTHYDGQGAIDGSRMTAHLRHLSPHVSAFLIAGSTGDGWEMNEVEFRELLGIVLEEAEALHLHLLIGALKTDARDALNLIQDTQAWITSRTSEREATRALAKARVCGFTVCPPRGRELSSEQIELALRLILDAGLPAAVYQLPQITQNEIDAQVLSRLATRYENLIMFKDSSGEDHVARSGQDLAGVVSFRGAEGDYARWLRGAGGPYYGFLLSTANCFAPELGRIVADVSGGRWEDARRMSGRLTTVINEAFRLAACLKDGNPFTNANKAIDHFFAHGPRAAEVPPPQLHAGTRLPVEVIRAMGEILSRHGFMAAKGYLD